MFTKKKKKYIAVFLMKEHGCYTIHKKRRFNPNISIIKYKKNVIPINAINYTHTEGLSLYFFISITEKKQLFFENSKSLVLGTKAIDLILNDEIIAQITSNLAKSNFKMNLMNIIFSALFGGLVGFIIGGFVPLGA